MLDYNSESQNTGSEDKIGLLLKEVRQKLIETGTRNRLIHINRANSKANALNIINERADDVFEILKPKSRKMRFKATGKDKTAKEYDAPLLIDKGENPEDLQNRYTDNQLETPLGPDAQSKRLLKLAKDAKTAEEEQGINILFLAIGFLTWFEDKTSAVKREAPLILLPVELVRNAQTSTYEILCRDDDIVANLPLQERLRGDFGIEIPDLDIDEEGWQPSVYFDKIQQNIASKLEWSIDRDGMQLGFFSFAKLLMLRDLDPENWPDGELENNALIKGLLASGFDSEAPLFGAEDRLDEVLAPADIIQVVDADASQTKVIQEVRAGRNLVVQGPPGTGKSQTITNIIASAVHDGKSVLFVAEKMAALSVVHNRLVNSGLESICLELHSRAANKKQVLNELAKTLNEGQSVPNSNVDTTELRSIRDQLNYAAASMHKPVGKSGQTPFQIIGELTKYHGQGAPTPTTDGTKLSALNKEQMKQVAALFPKYREHLSNYASPQSHPLFGIANYELQPLDISRAAKEAARLAAKCEDFFQKADGVVKPVGSEATTFSEIHDVASFYSGIGKAPLKAEQLAGIFSNENELGRINAALEAGLEWKRELLEIQGVYRDAAWSVPVEHLRAPIASALSGMFAKLKPSFRSASKELETLISDPLPKTAHERLQLLDGLISAKSKRKSFEAETVYLQTTLQAAWEGERTDFVSVLNVSKWVQWIGGFGIKLPSTKLATFVASKEKVENAGRYLSDQSATLIKEINTLFDVLKFDTIQVFKQPDINTIDLQTIAGKLKEVAEHAESHYGDWQQLSRIISVIEQLELGNILEKMNAGSLDENQAKTEIYYARAESLWKVSREQYPDLDQISQLPRHEIVKRFRSLEKDRIRDVKTDIKAKHLAQLPSGSIGEMGIIRGEIGKKTRHKPVRQLVKLTGNMLQRIKPVLLMSPISIAQFLPPKSMEFDLLVIDEASQVKPEDALGAIARAKQIVVVGDKKQLPPTAFFERMTGNAEDDDEEDDPLGGMARAGELESILTLCEARSIPNRMLEWHYRSRDPSLIRVSNSEFYNNNLVLPPSPLENDSNYGMKFTRVNGAYSSKSRGDGSPGTNKMEAQAIVSEIAEHARQNPDLSLGVVAFSVTQRNMITEIMEYERRLDPVLDNFLREGRSEDVFVKNIENVQGDERDVILVSVGYGPNEPGGKIASMSFGPVNGEGGERRLNVLFSRARVKCEIFASFEPGDIDLSRTQKEGPRILKRYMEFAKTGVLDQAIPTGGDADSPFEEDVANEITKLGYIVDNQVGSAGFMIDLGVKHPKHAGQYMLAVECDGATYHSALWARERDRLRQDVLENLGWSFHRIWSTDWFYRRQPEIERLKLALQEATEAIGNGITVKGANEGFDFIPSEAEPVSTQTKTTIDVLAMPELSSPPYIKADLNIRSTVEPHEAPMASLVEIVKQIVQIEGPIHEKEVARRLAASFGKEQAGRRIVEVTLEALKKARSLTTDIPLHNQDQFWLTAEQAANPPIRDRSAESTNIQKAEHLPPIEIRAAVYKVMAESGSANDDEIIRATARLFGFERVGPSLKLVIEKIVSELPDAE